MGSVCSRQVEHFLLVDHTPPGLTWLLLTSAWHMKIILDVDGGAVAQITASRSATDQLKRIDKHWYRWRSELSNFVCVE